jgi:hypothetical protein
MNLLRDFLAHPVVQFICGLIVLPLFFAAIVTLAAFIEALQPERIFQ